MRHSEKKYAAMIMKRERKKMIILYKFERRKIFVRREDRACCIFYSPAPPEIEEGVSEIDTV